MYQNAHMMYKNIEKLMDYINSNATYNAKVFYSTPSIYAEAIKAANPTLPVKTDGISFPAREIVVTYLSFL